MSSCFVIEMVYEKTLFIALHCMQVNLNPRPSLIPISSQYWITDSLSEKLMDSGFRSLVGSRIPWWAECPGIRIPQAKISRIPEFGLPGDSKWLKDGMCFLWWPFYIFRSAAVRSGTEKFWGIRDNWKFRKFSKIYSLTDPLPTMYKRDPIGFARIFVSRPCFSWTHNSIQLCLSWQGNRFIHL